MKFTKKCDSTQHKISKTSMLDRRRSSAGMFYTSSAGAVISLILMLALPLIFGFTGATNLLGLGGSAHATASTLTISVTDSVALNISSLSDTGNFAHSDTSTNNVSIITNNGTGYTLGIKAKTNNSNALINSDDTSKTIPSITTSISESTYASSSSYNNTWGLRPSKLNSAANENYIQAPTSASTLTTLDKTTSANPSTANNYNLAIGARVNSSTVPGSYSNVFVITVTANPIPYTITYNKNTTDTVTNMPANTSSQTYNEKVNISSQVPVRDGFNFKGWCTTQTADGGTCTGTTYNPDGGGTALTWTLNQTVSSNSLNLYAMWEQAITMQSATWDDLQNLIPNTGDSIRLVDERDGQKYWVGRQADGNVWMTQNLDLDIGGTGVATLTSENTDLNTSGTAPYADGYQNTGGVITWNPDDTAKPSGRVIYSDDTVSGWTDDSSEPYSAEGGDRYYYTTGTTSDETAQTLAQCIAAGHSEEDCAHYHSGNYYNWTAAIASNASSGISTRYAVAANSICPKGWKLPQGRASSDTSTTRQFGYLWQQAGITSSLTATSYATDGFNNIRTSPLFFVRGSFILGDSLYDSGGSGVYWSSSVDSTSSAYYALFFSSGIYSASNDGGRDFGQSVRCVKTPPTLYDFVAKQSKGTQTLAQLRAAITTSNSGVYEYNASVFGTASDASNDNKIYYYRGILDNTTGTYGSDGDNAKYPNTVVLSSASSKGSLKTSDTCWRIVRTTGSGGVKMIYQGKWTGSTCANSGDNAQVTTKAFGGTSLAVYRSIVGVGYTRNANYAKTTATTSTAYSTIFGSNSSYSGNSTASDMKTYIEDTWFSNINSYTSKLEQSAGWCNDRSIRSSSSSTSVIPDSTKIVPYGTKSMTEYYFGSYVRTKTTSDKPTLRCPRNNADLYTTSSATNGNKQLGKPAALITADESAFAGSGVDASTTPYHANSYLRSGSSFWLLSPYYRGSGGGAYGFLLYMYGYLTSGGLSGTNGVRPSISLASGTTAVSGTGTAVDPWIVNP